MQSRFFLFTFAFFSLYAQTTPNPPIAQNLTGFDNILWGTTYQEVKDRFVALAQSSQVEDKVEILQDTPEREILVSRKGILYRYVFYQKPTSIRKTTELPPNTDNIPDNALQKNPGRFFFAESLFPLVSANDLYQKLSEKYGQMTNKVFQEKEQRGAYLWDFADGLLVQWIEPYEKKPYTRNLYYVSKKIREEIYLDLQDYNYQKELKILKDILP